MSWQQRGNHGNEDRVFFQVHGLPQVLKLKIASDSPLHHLFEHIPAQKYQPPLCIDGPEYIWRELVLDPLKTPEDYDMPAGERNVQVIQVNFPLVSPRTALHAQQSRGGDESHQHLHEDTPRNGAMSARLSIDGDRRSPMPNSARAGETATPTAYNNRASPRTQPLPSVDKIIDDLTQALRGAEDEIEELQKRLAEKTRQVEHSKPEKLQELERENARLKAELDSERRENDSKQEAIQILRNKISAHEAAASRIQETAAAADGGSGGGGSNAAEALATSLRHHCHSLEGELTNREDEVRQLLLKISGLETDLEVVRSSAEEDAKCHKEALERLEATYAVQRKKDEASLDSEDSLRLRIDRLERENAILQSDNTTLAQRVVAAENNKSELRGLRNQHEIDTAAWGAQKNAYEKEIKSLREKCAEQLLQSQRHEKVLSERNASLQEKIAYFEDPRSVTQREEEFQQRELEMRSRLRDALAENDRLKTIHKDLKRQVSELETSLFECNNVLVRVQRENTDLKRAGIGFANSSQNGTPRFEGRLPASARTSSAPQQMIGSPLPAAPQQASAAVASSKAADSALLHIDPFSLVRGTPADVRGSTSPNVSDALLLSRHANSFRGAAPAAEDPRSGSRTSSAVNATPNAAALAEFQDA